MNKQQEFRIEQDIRENIRWLFNGEPQKLSNAAVSTIMAIIRVNLEKTEK